MKRQEDISKALSRMEGLDMADQGPSPEVMSALQERALVSSLKPVQPLPSNGVLMLMGVGCFVAFCVMVAGSLGLAGYYHLSLDQKSAYYAVILLCALLLTMALVLDFVPGSKRRVRPEVLLVVPVGLVILIAVALFPRPDFVRFVPIGFPCLRLATICAAVSGGLSYLLLRQAFSVAPIRTAAAGGLLAGLAGFGVLALHCPVQNYAHILIWHVGAILLACLGGLLIELARRRFSS